MQALETTGTIDKQGFLHLSKPLIYREKSVKVIVLLPDEEENEEKLWLKATSNNPVFNFLHDENEDIYSLKDGEFLA